MSITYLCPTHNTKNKNIRCEYCEYESQPITRKKLVELYTEYSKSVKNIKNINSLSAFIEWLKII